MKKVMMKEIEASSFMLKEVVDVVKWKFGCGEIVWKGSGNLSCW
jgi:hypothetical protein